MNYLPYFYDFIPLAFGHLLALLSPGADFFVIISNTSKAGKLSGVLTSFGIAFANLIYILLALLGITFIKDYQNIFDLIKILGALYLLYIAYCLIKSSKRDIFSNKETTKKTISLKKSFLLGFLSAILNPKNSIFYLTLFSISIKEHTPIIVQSLYASWMFLAVLFWDIFIVYLLSLKKAKIFMQKYSIYIEKGSGVFLALIAILILVFK